MIKTFKILRGVVRRGKDGRWLFFDNDIEDRDIYNVGVPLPKEGSAYFDELEKRPEENEELFEKERDLVRSKAAKAALGGRCFFVFDEVEAEVEEDD